MIQEELQREDAAFAVDCRKIYVDEAAIPCTPGCTIRKVQAGWSVLAGPDSDGA